MNIIYLAFICLLVFTPHVKARTSAYYDIVNAISEGKDLYTILGVTESSTVPDIRKAFRKLSIEYHPDKNPNADPNKYIYITFAYEVLSDSDKKKEYDDLLRFGVPRSHAFYGRYAYRYGAPSIDAEYVLVGLVAIISIFQYSYGWYRHWWLTSKVKETTRYKTQANLARKEGKPEPDVVVYGAEKPKWQNVIAVRLILLPYTFVMWIIWIVKGRPGMSDEEMEVYIQERFGMTREEYEMKTKAKMKEIQNSNKAKQYRRFMKKHS